MPAQLKRVVDAAEADDFIRVQLAKFDAILVGGQSVPAELVARAHALGANIVVTYGMTETSGGCVYNGNPLAEVEVRIASDGRVAIRGATLANVATDDRGYFVTNDAGEIGDAGKLIIHGRIDRVITSGGIKVSLDRVEALGAAVVGVADIAAVAIEDSEWGQRVGIAYVGSPEVADTVALALANDLGPAGKPVRILRVDTVPKLSAGKNDLQAIKKLFEEKR